jgi:hypothetical protein
MVTGSNWGSEPYHIITSSADNNPDMQFWPAQWFWPSLKMLRSNAEVTALKESLGSRKGQLQNLLMLGAGLHKAWANAEIAFKPVRTPPDLDAPNRMAIKFHVLRNVSPGAVCHVHDNNFLAPIGDTRTGKQIKSGYVLESSDPDTSFRVPIT